MGVKCGSDVEADVELAGLNGHQPADGPVLILFDTTVMLTVFMINDPAVRSRAPANAPALPRKATASVKRCDLGEHLVTQSLCAVFLAFDVPHTLHARLLISAEWAVHPAFRWRES